MGTPTPAIPTENWRNTNSSGEKADPSASAVGGKTHFQLRVGSTYVKSKVKIAQKFSFV